MYMCVYIHIYMRVCVCCEEIFLAFSIKGVNPGSCIVHTLKGKPDEHHGFKHLTISYLPPLKNCEYVCVCVYIYVYMCVCVWYAFSDENIRGLSISRFRICRL